MLNKNIATGHKENKAKALRRWPTALLCGWLAGLRWWVQPWGTPHAMLGRGLPPGLALAVVVGGLQGLAVAEALHWMWPALMEFPQVDPLQLRDCPSTI